MMKSGAMPDTTRIALLRGINVTGQNKIPMADLRALCAELGWRDVQTYIQSGNVVFVAGAPAERLEAELEAGITRRFGLRIAVIVRDTAAWRAYLAANPFPEASRAEPNRVMLALSKAPPRPDAAAKLGERAAAGERIEQVGDALWVHYPGGAGTSKLSPTLFDRLAGSPVTARNWRTVQKLAELAGV